MVLTELLEMFNLTAILILKQTQQWAICKMEFSILQCKSIMLEDSMNLDQANNLKWLLDD